MNVEQPQPAKILLIDDNQDNLDLLRELLERDGYQVTSVTDGQSALEQIRVVQPDLVLSDVMMPGLNGFQVTHRIRSDSSLGFIPIILLTARTDSNDKIRSIEAGADDFLVKPIQRVELVARVRSLLRLKRSTDALLQAAEENARLYVEAETRAAELSTLNETALAVGAQLTLSELLNLIASKSCELVKASSASIYLCNDELGNLTVMAEHNTVKSYLGRTVTYGEGVAGMVAITGKPMRINNYAEWSGRAAAYATDHNITSVLGIPLITGGRVVGVLDVMDDVKKRIFSDDDVRLLNLLAPQAAIAVTNALLYDEVRRERDQIGAVLNSVKDGILMLDRNYNVVLANPRFTELLGLEANHVIGRTLNEVVEILGEQLEAEPPFSADTVIEILSKLRRNPTAGFQRDLIIMDGKRHWLNWTILPVFDQFGAAIAWLNVFHETTQQRELEQVREDFISMLVHDLRSPLTSIIGGIELVTSMLPEEPTPNSEPQAEFLDQVERNAYNMLNMINALLEVSRLEAGRMPLHLEVGNLRTLVENSMAQVNIMAHEKQIEFQLDLPENDILINVDRDKMGRVIVNLLSNAINFNPVGQPILITAQVENRIRRRATTSHLQADQDATGMLSQTENVAKALVLMVQDQGPGIPPASLEHIFDKFIQVPNVTKNKSGTGLGLALCKLVIEAHEGRIWAESEYGKGSTFVFSMPCVVDDKAGDL